MAYLKDLASLPNERFYAILTVTSITIPGDERSRTHPGHGYPESTQTVPHLQYFTDEAEWKSEIEKLTFPKYGARANFRAFVLDPVSVEPHVEIEIKTP